MFCELTTGKEWQSSISSWFRTFFLTSPWNCSSPLKLRGTQTHRQHQCRRRRAKTLSNTHSATEAWSLEMSLVFLNSLHRVTRATQKGWLGKQRAWKTLSTKSGQCLFQTLTHFSCVVKISKKPFVRMRSSILTKGIDTLERQNSDQSQVTHLKVERKTKSVRRCTCHCADCLLRCSATCPQTAPGLHRRPGSAWGARTRTGRRSAPARKQQTWRRCFSVCAIHPSIQKQSPHHTGCLENLFTLTLFFFFFLLV